MGLIKDSKYIKDLSTYFMYMIFSNLRFTRPIFLIFILDKGISLFEFSILQIIYFSSRILSNVPSGILADLLRKRNVISMGLLMSSCSFLLLFISTYLDMSNYFYFFIIAFILDGIGSAFCSGADQAMVYEHLKEKGVEKHYVKIFGIKEALVATALGLSAFIGGFAAASYLSLPFLMQSIAGIVATLAVLRFKESVQEVKVTKNPSMINKLQSGYRVVKKLPYIQFLILFMAIISSSTNSVIMFTQSRFAELELSNSTIGTIYLGSTIISVIISLNVNLVMKFKLNTIATLVMGIFFVGGIFIISSNIILAIIGYYLIYVTIDILEPPLFFTINELVQENVRATVLSFFSTVLSIISLIMFLIYGLTGDIGGYENLIILMLVIHIPLFAFVFYYYKKELLTTNKVDKYI
ncbi:MULTISPECIES: MFS transporter [Bacillus cereus group]|uniref:Major facilitator superfamily MFS_1 n=2 Tax=Bacillus cytotoxicus TaxID=580165 RepID=A7GQK5_BACCN|nr:MULTISPECIES: MFS transporter [Bacillus cereus group]ABS22413.1 major facilitator superfamily MFS_1 [Bacillus cytotoxicus NVH 391-98]AWC33010.1 MFS transporter [Bacillus cytotoxicus]AWC37036.1 MFS transporter [Bacillus cytotoxicus]AWC45073.1 MFS transporter [Bacillus cytotoxicus]AWC61300.1 MFS transporter [Bacillus cytotoxicus]